MFNTVSSGDIQPRKINLFECSNRVRKSWVLMIAGSRLEFRIHTYPRNERFKIYSEIDKAILIEYTKLLKAYKTSKVEEGLVSGRSILGCHVLEKSALIDVDSYLIQATENVLTELYKNLEEYKEII